MSGIQSRETAHCLAAPGPYRAGLMPKLMPMELGLGLTPGDCAGTSVRLGVFGHRLLQRRVGAERLSLAGGLEADAPIEALGELVGLGGP